MYQVSKSAAALIVVAAVFSLGSVRAEDKRIAVVNVSDVFSRFDRVKDVQESLGKAYKPKQEELQGKERKMKVWKEQIDQDDQIKPKNDRDLFANKQKFQQALFDLQAEYEALTAEVEKRRKDEMQAILTEIKRVIGVIGKQERFDLVMRAPEYAGEFDPAKAAKKDDEQITAPELVRRFRDNPVLYFAEGADITDKVVTELNREYKAKPPAPIGANK
jgi:Skp family chaperone for outer membrane proteins